MARNIAQTQKVTLRRMQREVGTGKGYRWAPGYIVVNPANGAEEYPPVDFDEAQRRVRELVGHSQAYIIV